MRWEATASFYTLTGRVASVSPRACGVGLTEFSAVYISKLAPSRAKGNARCAAIRFLSDYEDQGVVLIHCPPYVREWILREHAYYGPSGPVIPLEVGRSFRCDVGREWVVMWAAFLVSP